MLAFSFSFFFWQNPLTHVCCTLVFFPWLVYLGWPHGRWCTCATTLKPRSWLSEVVPGCCHIMLGWCESLCDLHWTHRSWLIRFFFGAIVFCEGGVCLFLVMYSLLFVVICMCVCPKKRETETMSELWNFFFFSFCVSFVWSAYFFCFLGFFFLSETFFTFLDFHFHEMVRLLASRSTH